MSAMTYVALIHKANKEGADYGVIFPDFPGCISGGKTLDQAINNARDGLLFHIEGMLGVGELIPEPSPLEKIKEEFGSISRAHYEYIVLPHQHLHQ